MGRARANQVDPVLDGPEAAAFGSATGLFSGSEVTGRVLELDDTAIDNAWHDDERVAVGGGDDEQIPGLSYEDLALPLTTYVEGLTGTGAGDGETATQGFVGHLVSAAFQSAPDLTTGQLTDVGSTETSVVGATAGASALTLASIGLALLQLADGSYVWRPYEDADPNLTLLMAAPEALAAGRIIAGTAIYPYVDGWTSAAPPYSIGAKLVNREGGEDTDYQLYGGVSTFEIPEAAVGAVPRMNHNVRFAGFDDLSDLAAGTPASVAGTVVAGMDCLLGAYGSTVGEAKCLDSWAFNLNADYEHLPCSSRANEHGTSGVNRGSGVPELTLTFKRGETPPVAIASGATKFRTSRRTGGDVYHVMLGLTRGGRGKAAALYLPECVLAGVKQIKVGNRTAEQVMFRPKAGTAHPLVVYGRG